jgi:hypothetical protein
MLANVEPRATAAAPRLFGSASSLARDCQLAINRPNCHSFSTRAYPKRSVHEETSMKLVLTLLGVVLLIIAAVYVLVPAD